jgi:hypothetical protein
MKPVCFMVMPFRRKPVTQAESGAPREVDFDRLWDAAFRPTLEQLGYLPVRADLESGSVIVKEMLNRLRHADFVLADVSISNGNVYYEVGIRHAAQEKRCVCIAADWFKPLFDIAQFRVLPLSPQRGRGLRRKCRGRKEPSGKGASTPRAGAHPLFRAHGRNGFLGACGNY